MVVRDRMRGWAPGRGSLVDAVLYAASAVFCAQTLAFATSVAHRTWAGFALPAYAGGAVVALVLASLAGRVSPMSLKSVRLLLVSSVVAGAVAIPLAVEVRWRADRGPEYAHSEVVVIESAAAEVVVRRNPYAATFSSPELAGRKPAIREHFPYLPGMAAFGLPRALKPDVWWTDARLFFALAVVAAVVGALHCWQAPLERRLVAFHVLVVLPTGALPLATGGDDLPVLALCLLALSLLTRSHGLAAGVAIAAAASLKLTAWPVLLALVVAVSLRRLREPAPAFVPLAVAAAWLPATLASGPAEFVEDVLLFPLGLTAQPSPAATPTAGSLVVDALVAAGTPSSARVAVTAGLLVAAVVLAAAVMLILVRRGGPGRSPAIAASEIATWSGILFVLLVVLAPVGRPGYLVYPLNLLLWGALLRERLPHLMEDGAGRRAVSPRSAVHGVAGVPR
jgi:hypothetical protein